MSKVQNLIIRTKPYRFETPSNIMYSYFFDVLS